MNNQQHAVHLETPVMKPERNYRPRYPKKLTLILSFIQLGIAFLAIITQVVMQIQSNDRSGPYYVREIQHLGAGVWCGILFGLSGGTGIAAILKQNTSCIIANMITSVISIIFGFTFFIISSIGTGNSSYMGNSTTHAMFAIQMAISIIQIMASSSFTAISSRAICNCCSDAKMSKKSFPQNPFKILSSLQLFLAVLIIIMEIAVMSRKDRLEPFSSIMPLGGGIWCGVIIGLSGVTGIIASFNPSSLKLLIFMVFDLIAALFCLPLIAFSSIGLTNPSRYELRTEEILCATTLALVVLEAILTMCSLILTCLNLCDCCRPHEEPKIIYYSNVYHDNVRDGSNIQSNFGTQSGYHAVPMRRMENVSISNSSKHLTPLSTNEVSAESVPPIVPLSDDNLISDKDPLVRANSENDGKASFKWQRFS